MTAGQRLTASLIPLDEALDALLDGLEPIASRELPIAETLGAVSVETPLPCPFPTSDIAVTDGWAFCAHDLVGASSYSPFPLAGPPVWVEAGDPMPSGSDCVVDSDLVERLGSMFQVSGEALPGQGVRRAGADIGEGGLTIAAGLRLRALDLMLARAAGLTQLAIRRPRLHLINIPMIAGHTVTAQLIAESARAAGADVLYSQAAGRDASSVAKALDGERCDLIVTIGGTGVGRTDATVEALTLRGALIAHGIALQPAAPLPSVRPIIFPSSLWPAHRIRRWRLGGRWCCQYWIGYRDTCSMRRRYRWRARYRQASELRISLYSRKATAPGCRWRSALFRSIISCAPMHGSPCPVAVRGLRREPRSMPIR